MQGSKLKSTHGWTDMTNATREYFEDLVSQFVGEFPEVIDDIDQQEIDWLDLKFFVTPACYNKNTTIRNH